MSLRTSGPVVNTDAVEGGWVFPLSFAQRRLWFLHQLEPANTFYNLPLAVPFNVPVNSAVLERSINEIVNRHEALRTFFATVEGEPMQIVRPTLNLALDVIDLRALAKDEQAAETARLIAEIAQQPFDLANAPLLRVALLRRGIQDYVFVLVMHHIISDGLSLGIFWRELIAIYNAFYINRPSPLSELPIQYADFAVWQRERLQGERLAHLTAYWRKQLGGLPTLQLPTDRPRPAVLSYRGAFHQLTLPRVLTSTLRSLSQREGVTFFMTVFAAFAVLLQRYSGQDEVIIGVPIASREPKELEGLIGFFINSLVLRADLAGDPSFRTLLARVRELALEAYAHQELPFEKLVEELQPERDLSRNPLFQVSFQLFSAPEKMHAEQVPTIAVNRGSAIFDLAVNLWEGADEIGGQLEYSSDLFEASTIARLAGHFRTLLKNASTNPEAKLSELYMLTDGEQHQILFEWNETAVGVPQFCVHQLFEQRASENPGALAVTAHNEAITYGELNERANRLAHSLHALGVGHETLVCVCLERRISMVVALLAVLKSGGAYVPLDPSYPSDRLGLMLEDSGAKVVLSDRASAGRLPAGNAALLLLDDEGVFNDSPPSNAIAEYGVSLDDICYVIYTSGSTGRPKGVAVPHRGLTNLVAWHRRAFTVSPADRASQVASPGFDACGWELWPYLTTGASVHIVADNVRASPPDLLRVLREKKITIAFLPTPVAQMVFDDSGCAGLRLRYLLVGGDKLTRVPAPGSDFVVVNNYGPTECSVVATSCEIGAGQDLPPSIGRPIDNTQVYVLDRYLNPVPIGVAGELYIGGQGLARGYHNSPALTAENFIANPIPGAVGSRLYKSGDLVRYRKDGTLEYLGRTDHQIKIRGFRVELGEIEAVLTGHKDVSDAVVTVVSSAGESGHLVAYVSPKQSLALNSNGVADSSLQQLTTSLRIRLRAQLPEYMVPTDIVILRQLPQTSNGKVDRRALPSPELARGENDQAYAAPRTPLEEVLAGIWAEVLDLDHVGIDDNFFKIGGHSLLAVRTISRVRDRLKVEVPLQTLFRCPTPAQFAASLLATADNPTGLEKIAQLVASVASLSDAEVKQMLAKVQAVGDARKVHK